jgi:AsmA family protein
MNGSLVSSSFPKWAALSLAALAALILGAMLLAAAVDAGYFRGSLVRALSARSGRQIQILGSWQVQLFSMHPRLTAERVTIGNPPWMPPGQMAQIGKVSLVFQMPGFHQSFGVDRLELEAVTLHLVRDPMGQANWQLTDPNKGPGKGLPLIRSLSMPNARVELDDARRHLQFSGTASVSEGADPQGAHPLQIDGAGRLNGRADAFAIVGDPLAGVSHDRPYHFTFVERSSGTRLSGQGLLLRPFKFDAIDASFDAVGEDLKDLYFLAGVTLVNTGSYRLSGKLALRGKTSTFSDLLATSGQSDMRGRVSIDTSSGRPKLAIELDSRFLRLSDLGARAAGREPQTTVPRMLSDAMLSPSALRRSDAVVNFRAQSVEVAHVPLRQVSARVTIDQGILTVAPLLAGILEGRLSAHVRLDANRDVPPVEVDINVSDLQIGQLTHNDSAQPPFEGLLRARINVTGEGRSIHQVAASANGAVTAVLPHGTLRASLAELAGLDLRGLGLLAVKSTQDTPIRCAVAGFRARRGILAAENLTVDTDPVLVTGDGDIDLDSESLDLSFRGHPKKLRLVRLRSALLLRGTLSHPSIDIQAGHAVAQVAEAVAAGVVLTPLAALLAFVDPGLTKDADCGALLSAAAATPR